MKIGNSVLEEKKRKLEAYVVGAIILSKKRGGKLARNYPEMAGMYRIGCTLEGLAKMFSPDWEKSESVAISSIYYALREFIPVKELEELGKLHSCNNIKEHGRSGGATTFERGHGCFDMSKEENIDGRKSGGEAGGAKTGKKNYEAGKGIANMSKEDLNQASIRGVFSRGEIPYESQARETEFGKMNEKSYVIFLKKEGHSWREIAEIVNSIFDNNRSLETLRSNYNQRWRK